MLKLLFVMFQTAFTLKNQKISTYIMTFVSKRLIPVIYTGYTPTIT